MKQRLPTTPGRHVAPLHHELTRGKILSANRQSYHSWSSRGFFGAVRFRPAPIIVLCFGRQYIRCEKVALETMEVKIVQSKYGLASCCVTLSPPSSSIKKAPSHSALSSLPTGVDSSTLGAALVARFLFPYGLEYGAAT
jgi:hypothetical protein